jgi:hypothetical protein
VNAFRILREQSGANEMTVKQVHSGV